MYKKRRNLLKVDWKIMIKSWTILTSELQKVLFLCASSPNNRLIRTGETSLREGQAVSMLEEESGVCKEQDGTSLRPTPTKSSWFRQTREIVMKMLNKRMKLKLRGQNRWSLLCLSYYHKLRETNHMGTLLSTQKLLQTKRQNSISSMERRIKMANLSVVIIWSRMNKLNYLLTKLTIRIHQSLHLTNPTMMVKSLTNKVKWFWKKSGQIRWPQ